MQLDSVDGKIHFYVDGVEKGTSYRDDYVDLGSEMGLYTMFNDPLSDWDPKPYTIWDDVEFGSDYGGEMLVPEPAAVLLLGLPMLLIRRRR